LGFAVFLPFQKQTAFLGGLFMDGAQFVVFGF
jgi:hypothetical protein